MIQCAFVPDGYFYLKDSSLAGFENFDHIALLLSDIGKKRPLADSRLYTEGASYKFIRLGEFVTHSSGRGITFEFETETVEGISYKFTGKFTSICDFAEGESDPKQTVALGGITMFRDGKEAATADVQFTYSKSPRTSPATRPEPKQLGFRPSTMMIVLLYDAVNSGVRR